MWIIDRNGSSIRELSSAERSLIIGNTQNTLSPHDQERANRILREARRESHWLGCDCATPMPMMNVALRESGTLVLRNNPNGNAHFNDCQLTKQESSAENDNYNSGHSVSRIAPDSHLALHSEFSEPSKGNTQQISRSSATVKAPQKKRLLSLLISSIEGAGLHEYDPGATKTITEQFQRLREVIWRYQLAPGVPAQSFTDTRIDKRRITGLAAKLRDTKSFGKHRKYGVMLDVVNNIKGRKIEPTTGEPLNFFGHVERWEFASGPILVMATLSTQSQTSTFFELGHVAMIPVLSSRSLIPVVSNGDRDKLNSLVGLIDWMYEKHKARITLRRQLFSPLHLIELQGRGKQLIVDLSDNQTNIAAPSSAVIHLNESQGDIGLFKRKVARYFLGEH